jgi:hypothetical protein
MTGIYLVYTWNILFFSYARYIPGIFRSYTTDGHMTGIYLVYSQDLRFLGIPDGELTSTSCIFLKKDTTLAYLLHWGSDDSDSRCHCIYAHPTGTSSLPVLPDCVTVTVAF